MPRARTLEHAEFLVPALILASEAELARGDREDCIEHIARATAKTS